MLSVQRTLQRTLSRNLATTGSACPRCGATVGVYPTHGAVVALGDVLGLERFRCGRCRRGFWLRSESAPTDFIRKDPEEGVLPSDRDPLDPEGASWAVEPAATDGVEEPQDEGAGPIGALDVEPLASSDPLDLAALDAELARLRRTRKSR